MKTIYVEITSTRGSAPRDAGTVMAVTAQNTQGTIGGGALEHRAILHARKMLVDGLEVTEQAVPLGPSLGQCCGGSVSLKYHRNLRLFDMPQVTPPLSPTPDTNVPLWVWGAGHVGRAVVRLAAPLPCFDLHWIDTGTARFPTTIPDTVTKIPAADMPLVASRAPQHAHHLIFTYSHQIDLALCAALLKRTAASIGLIGSQTKRTRFFSRLTDMGLDPAGITCPIGDKSRGKHPDHIASGTLAALLAHIGAKESA